MLDLWCLVFLLFRCVMCILLRLRLCSGRLCRMIVDVWLKVCCVCRVRCVVWMLSRCCLVLSVALWILWVV